MCIFPARAADRIVDVDVSGGTAALTALLVNPTGHKLYAGQQYTTEGNVSGLFVFDINSQGEISDSDERSYPCMVPSGDKVWRTSVNCIAISPDRTKLYLGIDYAAEEIKDTLIVYDLDEKGEPKGKPRSYKTGNPHFVLQTMAVHSKLNFLYTGGWGGAGVYAMPLKKGEPTNEPVDYGIGGQGKWTMVPNDNFTAMFLGTYPSVIEVVNVNPSGEIEKLGSPCKVSELPEYLCLRRVGKCIYFTQAGKLWSWLFTGDLEPAGEPKAALTSWDAAHGLPPSANNLFIDCMYSTKTSLYAVLAETDKQAKNPVALSFRIARFKPDAKGEIGKAEFVSAEPDTRHLNSITVDETSGVIYINAHKP